MFSSFDYAAIRRELRRWLADDELERVCQNMEDGDVRDAIDFLQSKIEQLPASVTSCSPMPEEMKRTVRMEDTLCDDAISLYARFLRWRQMIEWLSETAPVVGTS